MTKILANRLKKILANIISQEQNCSIPKRNIFNNIFLIRVATRYNKEKNTHFYIMQVDQEKVFDKIDQQFLYKTMIKMGFSETFISFIKTLYKNNTSSIINKGYLSQQIQIQRGLRQGCPLSLPLYVIQGEVTTKNINQDNNITGIRIPNHNKQVKISQYADDSNFLLTNQNSAKQVLNFFQKLTKATGTSINFDKTIILPINTDQINYLQHNLPDITIKERCDTIKILGIYFCEGLRETNITNSQNILQKIEKHINTLYPRNLSLMGKGVILNTLILLKTSFLSNIFPIPKDILTQFHKKIFRYIWKQKTIEPIARKTLFLPKKKEV